jgi:hypothetical protein
MAPSLSRGAQKKRIGADDVVKGNFSLAEEGAELHRPRSGSKFHLIDACSRGIPLPRTPQAALAFTRLSPIDRLAALAELSEAGGRRVPADRRRGATRFLPLASYSRAAVLERRACRAAARNGTRRGCTTRRWRSAACSPWPAPCSRSQSWRSPPVGFMIRNRIRVVKRHPGGDW